MRRVRLLYSYADKDQQLADEFASHLKTLPEEEVEVWNAGLIEAGQEWQHATADNLAVADIILFLISIDLIAFNKKYAAELRQAISRHEAGTATIIPVLLRPVDLSDTLFERLRSLPKSGQPVADCKDVAQRDRVWVNEVLAGLKQAIASARKRITLTTEPEPSLAPANPPLPTGKPSEGPQSALTVFLTPALAGVQVQVLSEDGSQIFAHRVSREGEGKLQFHAPAGPLRLEVVYSKRASGQTSLVRVTSDRIAARAGQQQVRSISLPYSLAYADAVQRWHQRLYQLLAHLRYNLGRYLLILSITLATIVSVAAIYGHFADGDPGMMYVRKAYYKGGLGLSGLDKRSHARRALGVVSNLIHYMKSDHLIPAVFSNPPHEPKEPLTPFFLAQHEVTVQAYRRYYELITDASRKQAAQPIEWSRQEQEDRELARSGDKDSRPSLPVRYLTWLQASNYCKAQGGRLPTGDEWEVAARNLSPLLSGSANADGEAEGAAAREDESTDTLYPWGNAFYQGQAHTHERLHSEPVAVCSTIGDRTHHKPWLCDMGGNVHEWVADQAPCDDKEGEERVCYRYRGASYKHVGEVEAMGYVAYESRENNKVWDDLGFRCAYDQQPSKEVEPTVTHIPGGRYALGQPRDPLFANLAKWRDNIALAELLFDWPDPVEQVGDLFVQRQKVRNSQYWRFLDETGDGHGAWCQKQGEPKDHRHLLPRTGSGDAPALGLSFFDAWAYCGRYGMRLPTADEWERIVRGERPEDEQDSPFPWAGRDQRGQPRKLDAFLKEDDNLSHQLVRSMFLDGGEWTNTNGPGNDRSLRILKGRIFSSLEHVSHTDDPVTYITSLRIPMPPDRKPLEAGFRCVAERVPSALEKLASSWFPGIRPSSGQPLTVFDRLVLSRRLREQPLIWPPAEAGLH